MNTTVSYYEKNAEQFFDSTVNVDMSSLYCHFTPLLPNKAKILDVGCGSGRDTKYFISQGFNVDAIDVTEEFCRLASQYTGILVQKINVLDLNVHNQYDAIWACASLLHLEPENLDQAFSNLKNALKEEGIFYTSFKYGNFCGIRNGRHFTNLTENSFSELLSRVGGFKIVDQFLTGDVRKGRESEKWLNIVLRKVKPH